MPKEQLRLSLDDLLAFRRLTVTYRDVVQQMLSTHPEVNDEMTIVMIAAHNGMGNILVALYKAMEIIQERMTVFGDGEGFKKQLMADFKEDGADLNDTQMEQESEEYQDGQDDDEEYRDEWGLPPD